MATWFTADTHFGHAKVLGGRHARPFASVTEMDNALVERWNATVAPNDECWHLGDFSTYQDARLETVFHRLHGRKHLILGNHDEENDLVSLLDWQETPTQQRMIRLDKRDIYLCHFPIRRWPRCQKDSLQLYGHMHAALPPERQSLDVGVDAWDLRPVSLPDIERRMHAALEGRW